jgi:hypothetical protein
MNVKRILICSVLILGTATVLCAQKYRESFQEVRFGVGVRGPVDRSLGWNSSEIVSLSYAHYGQKGFGYRFGAEFMPENMDVDTYFGFPVAFSARTRARTFSESVTTGLESAAVGAVRDAVYGYEPTAQSILGDFFFGLFNRAEFFVGLTPGCIAGTNVPLKKSSYDALAGEWDNQTTMALNSRFSLSADAGFSMSFRIWQFHLGFAPAVHYFLTKNFVSVSTTGLAAGGDAGARVTETPIRFQYSVLGFLSFSF